MAATSATAASTACCKSGSPPSSSASGGRQRTSTGYVRPVTSTTGAGPWGVAKWAANRAASIVADVTITFRSRRFDSSRFKYPMRKSMFSDRSWASSRMIVSYWSSNGSPCVSASRMPSVISLMYVCDERASAKRTLKPTSRLSGEAELVGDPRGHAAGGDAARLRVADQPLDAAAQLQADFRQLRRFARAGFAANDHHLAVRGWRRRFRCVGPRPADRRRSKSAARRDAAPRASPPIAAPPRPAAATDRRSVFPPSPAPPAHAIPAENDADRRAWHGRSPFQVGTEWTLDAAAVVLPRSGARRRPTITPL